MLECDERARLSNEVRDFLYGEAWLLDERRFADWLTLLTNDMRYVVPIRLNVASERRAHQGGIATPRDEETVPGQEVCWMDEGLETLRQRVEQLLTNKHWAEEPPSRTTRIVSNVRILGVEGSEIIATSTVFLHLNRLANETTNLVGRREDRLRRETGSLYLAYRRVLLSQNVLQAKNLTQIL